MNKHKRKKKKKKKKVVEVKRGDLTAARWWFSREI